MKGALKLLSRKSKLLKQHKVIKDVHSNEEVVIDTYSTLSCKSQNHLKLLPSYLTSSFAPSGAGSRRLYGC